MGSKQGQIKKSQNPPCADENKLIVLCSRTHMQESEVTLAQELTGGKLSWSYIWQKSIRSWVAPLIYKNLLRINTNAPQDISERFKTAYILHAINNERRYRDLGMLLKAFNNEKITAVLYKGVILGEIIYGDIAFRPMSDFDLLIKTGDWQKIAAILPDLGYSCPTGVKIPAIAKESHICCINKNGTALEFKFNLYWLDIPEFQRESVWDEAIPAKIAGENTLIPSAEDHLLILSLALLRHRYTGLIWFCDINELLRHYQEQINWDKLIKKAGEKGVSAFLYYSLFLSRNMLEASVPDFVLKKLTPNPLRRKIFKHFHLLDNITTLQYRTEKKRSTPKSHLLQIFLIGKIGLNFKRNLKSLLYFARLALQSKNHHNH